MTATGASQLRRIAPSEAYRSCRIALEHGCRSNVPLKYFTRSVAGGPSDVVLGYSCSCRRRDEPSPQGVARKRCWVESYLSGRSLNDERDRAVGEARSTDFPALADWTKDGTVNNL